MCIENWGLVDLAKTLENRILKKIYNSDGRHIVYTPRNREDIKVDLKRLLKNAIDKILEEPAKCVTESHRKIEYDYWTQYYAEEIENCILNNNVLPEQALLQNYSTPLSRAIINLLRYHIDAESHIK